MFLVVIGLITPQTKNLVFYEKSISWRKDPLYQEVKKTFIWAIPILQLYNVYLFVFAFRTELKADQSIPGVIDILVLITLTSWQLISDISKKLKEKKLIVNQRKLILYLYFIYTTTIYSNVITSFFGETEVFNYWVAVFTGLGIIATFVSVTREIGRKYGAVNVNLFSFMFNTIKYSTEIKKEISINLCPSCNSPIKISDKFCGHCGLKLEKYVESNSSNI
ncbi:MAG: zinc ribbon domain-containing protein [Candidatus Heimdallarchaeaceae archaeon]